MFRWVKTRLAEWAGGVQQREKERLADENRRLKEEIEEANGGQRIILAAGQRNLLAERARNIDPETLKRLSVLASEEAEKLND